MLVSLHENATEAVDECTPTKPPRGRKAAGACCLTCSAPASARKKPACQLPVP